MSDLSLHPHHASFAARTLHGVRLDHRVVLLEDVVLGADVCAGEHRLQRFVVVVAFLQRFEHPLWRLARNRRLPYPDGPLVDRRIVRKVFVLNLGLQNAAMVDAHYVVGGNDADFGAIQTPLAKNRQHFLFATLRGHQQHALLRLRQHDLVGRHAGLTLRNLVQFDRDSEFAACAHLAGGTRQTGRAHVLNAENRASLHDFQTGFEQQLFEERIAHLDVRPLLL